jgi:hypothetical protein
VGNELFISPYFWSNTNLNERLHLAASCLLEVLNTTQFSVWFSRVSGRSPSEIKIPGLSDGFALGSSRQAMRGLEFRCRPKAVIPK